jgi:hypothetical protein
MQHRDPLISWHTGDGLESRGDCDTRGRQRAGFRVQSFRVHVQDGLSKHRESGRRCSVAPARHRNPVPGFGVRVQGPDSRRLKRLNQDFSPGRFLYSFLLRVHCVLFLV